MKEFESFVRKNSPSPGPGNDGAQLRIEYRYGFELFNTRPYHNYETWSSGWYVQCRNPFRTKEQEEEGMHEFIEDQGEHLPEAIKKFMITFMTYKHVTENDLWNTKIGKAQVKFFAHSIT